jgi:CubicO group peptidase (beta-lactamase class C family)
MTGMLDATADPASLGFDPSRLARIDRRFARYVDDGLLAGWQLVVTRGGEIAHASVYGLRDAEAGLAVEDDTLWRIYSMTKPITSVAAMSLWEEGHFELTDEVSRWIPAFADVRVYEKGSSTKPYTVPAAEPVRVWHLLSHTSGLTYGFLNTSVVDAIYRSSGYEWGSPAGTDLAGACDAWAGLPLLFQPGSAWGYSVATDVLGRLVEIWSGQPLDAAIASRITGPLGMSDTRWWVDPKSPDSARLAALYTPNPVTGLATRLDAFGAAALAPPRMLSGGGGLISTAADYERFTRMLLRGGELDGARVLSPRTLRFMTENHLPGGAELGALSTGGFAETTFDGIGFGLGFAVVLDPRPAKTLSSRGEYYWGGAASTAFWVDPAEEITAHFFTQLLPSSSHPLRPQLRQLVNSALV